ncbi:membrane-spanning 4-domains subfamily A member 15-like isoform X2 [Eublepharis macularius]|uniref:Membrane-spanning 4-domains subfamily A member 15-like isoform X2 n=1 Tax=Eublepharis macularius TaxID=481883 RepID=A0AA97KF88_EUBMA|nr:membrane-spanning 4-domains subfamily A member 15-like isoform X2 [Eublepharis macularius]
MALQSFGTFESFSTGKVAPSMSRPLKRFYKGEPMALGITQLLTGVLEIAFGTVLSLLNSHHFDAIDCQTPHWTGIMYIISGSLSVAAAKNPKILLVKGALAMNIISAVAAGIAIVIFSFSMTDQGPTGKAASGCGYGSNDTAVIQACHEATTIPYAIMYNTAAVLFMLTIVEFVIAIISAAFGCASVCRDSYSETTIVIYQNTAETSPPLPDA